MAEGAGGGLSTSRKSPPDSVLSALGIRKIMYIVP